MMVIPVHAQDVTSAELDKEFFKTLRNKIIPADSLMMVGNKIIADSEKIGYRKGIVRGTILRGLGFLYSNQLDSAARGFITAINEQGENNAKSFEAGLGHNYLGSVFTRLNNNNRALEEFNAAVVIFDHLQNIEYLAVALSNAGTAYGAKDNLIKALELFLQAQKLSSDERVTDNQRANILSNISIVYNMMGKRQEALRFAYAALAIDVSSANPVGICQSYNGIANIYKEHKFYDSAHFFFDKTIALAVGDAELQQIALRALLNKAEIYTIGKDYEKAIKLLREVQRNKSVYNIHSIYNYLSDYYLRVGRKDSAIYFAHRALAKSREAGSKISIATAFGHLNNAYAELKRFDSAYYYQLKQHAYNDSVYNENNRSRFDKLQIQLATLDKERELYAVMKEAELEKARHTILLLYTGAAFVSLVLLLWGVILWYKNRQKEALLKTRALEDELSKSHAELRDKALRIIHINNAFQEIEDHLKRISSGDSAGDVRQVLKSVTISKTLEREWDNFNEYFGSIHVGFYERLNQRFPTLSTSEKRLAGLVRMDLTNREIASILSIEDSSVKTAKHRLKKKLGLTDDQNLYQFLLQLTAEERDPVVTAS